MKPKKGDPCYCGSTLQYRNCHYPIDNAGPQHRVDASRRSYDEGWVENAVCYEAQGCYAWMAERLRLYNPQRIFDIGCGSGHGILALVQKFKSSALEIISVEENPRCINRTQKLLAAKGLQVSVVRRCEVVVRAPNTHALSTFSGRLRVLPGINLFEGDILVDDEIENCLQTQPVFDAVTVWLLGTHPVRYECYNIQGLNIKDTRDYRLRVQNKAYELANKILRPGGVLHIVDRGEVPATEDLKKGCLDSHRAQAAGFHTTLEVVDVLEFRQHTESNAPRRVPMFATPNSAGRSADLSRLAMCSVIAVKH